MGAAMTDRWSIKSTPAMDAEQFQLWQALLEERTGMTLSNERKTFLETSLSIRMRELGIEDYDTYYEHLMVGSTESRAMEWSVLVDRLTVQETSFFRHPSSYALVEEFVQRFKAEQPDGASLDVWSVGCSTGEEAYSLAMMINEQLWRRPQTVLRHHRHRHQPAHPGQGPQRRIPGAPGTAGRSATAGKIFSTQRQ